VAARGTIQQALAAAVVVLVVMVVVVVVAVVVMAAAVVVGMVASLTTQPRLVLRGCSVASPVCTTGHPKT
jgi:hypothetical protein